MPRTNEPSAAPAEEPKTVAATLRDFLSAIRRYRRFVARFIVLSIVATLCILVTALK